MNENRASISDDAVDMAGLPEKTRLFQPEYEYTAEKGSTFKVREFELVKYEKQESKNHTDIDLNASDAIIATLIDPRFPEIEIPNQDISVGFYLDEATAAWRFFEGMDEVCKSVKAYIDENALKVAYEASVG
jgi:hypothetical protein